ncbi:RNA methyltransferase [Ferrimicrobium sp.]|uniref:TrmH family RNA methyltransferase n=1 Tax=Ferrimicrobium sp. TaxID=2926050 RepID=UPI00262385A3|nr:RNA methyltransferase [Ferrimicrobium sp.]
MLRSRAGRRASRTYVLEGRRSLDQAIEIGEAIGTVFVTEERLEEYLQLGDQIRVVPERRLAHVSSLTNTDGVIGLAPMQLASFALLAAQECILFPVGLQDPGNLGTLIRSALAFFSRVGLVVGPKTVDPFSPKVVRATTGLISLVAVSEVDSYEQSLLELGKAGVSRLALVPHEAGNLMELRSAAPVALLVGSEAHGIEEALLAHCDGVISIPQRTQVESLNAGVAGSIALFHLAQTRDSSTSPQE